MTQKIDPDVMKRAEAITAAAEAAKPQPPMTDELRAEVAAARKAMVEGQATNYLPAQKPDAKAQADTAEVAQQATSPAIRQDARETLSRTGTFTTPKKAD